MRSMQRESGEQECLLAGAEHISFLQLFVLPGRTEDIERLLVAKTEG